MSRVVNQKRQKVKHIEISYFREDEKTLSEDESTDENSFLIVGCRRKRLMILTANITAMNARKPGKNGG